MAGGHCRRQSRPDGAKGCSVPEQANRSIANKVETLIGNDSLLCPILEFRGIGSCSVAELQAKPSNFLQLLATRVEHWHQQALSGQEYCSFETFYTGGPFKSFANYQKLKREFCLLYKRHRSLRQRSNSNERELLPISR